MTFLKYAEGFEPKEKPIKIIKKKKDVNEYNQICKERHRQYYIKNKVKIMLYQKNYKKQRMKIDSNFKFRTILRSTIWLRILKCNGKKHYKTKELIGCSIQQLKQHLEVQFDDEMSWYNYGIHGWHIDHIIPCAVFDLSKPEEQKKCFHYSNLQPLWCTDNWSKSKK